MQSRHLFEIGDEVEVDSQSVYLTKELSEEYNEEHLASLLASHDVFDSKPEGQSVSGEFSIKFDDETTCLLYTSPSPRDQRGSRMPSSA